MRPEAISTIVASSVQTALYPLVSRCAWDYITAKDFEMAGKIRWGILANRLIIADLFVKDFVR
jgi:uncharacterized protein YqgC (DUF456 family)